MKTGFVQMSLERYNELMALIQAMPTLKFEFKNFLNIIEDLLAETKYAGKYRVKDADSLYAEIIFGVFERISEDDEDQA